MEEFLLRIAAPPTRDWYLLFCFGVMVVPMLGLAIWYHRNIQRTAGGRELMRRQNANRPSPRSGLRRTGANLAEAWKMARDIGALRYGSQVRRMQQRVYLVTTVWLIAVVASFGLLLWADVVAQSQ